MLSFNSGSRTRERFPGTGRFSSRVSPWLAAPGREAIGVCDRNELLLQSRVAELIYRYRDLGHLLACLDPLVACPTDHPLLNLAAFRLTEQDLDRKFYTDHLAGDGQATLRDILQALRDTYCHSIGVEYMHIQDPAERRWLQERMEPVRNRPQLDPSDQLRILDRLYHADLFEQFLHTKYLGQKRFSLEGAEAIMVLLDTSAAARRRAGMRGNHPGHGAPGAFECAGEFPGETVRCRVLRV